MKQYYDFNEACQAMNMTKKELHRRILEGEFQPVNSGLYAYIPGEQVRRYCTFSDGDNRLSVVK